MSIPEGMGVSGDEPDVVGVIVFVPDFEANLNAFGLDWPDSRSPDATTLGRNMVTLPVLGSTKNGGLLCNLAQLCIIAFCTLAALLVLLEKCRTSLKLLR